MFESGGPKQWEFACGLKSVRHFHHVRHFRPPRPPLSREAYLPRKCTQRKKILRSFHSQNKKYDPRRCDFCFHGRRNARLPFAKTLAYLQIAQINDIVIPTVSTSAWTRVYHSQKQQSVYRLRKCGFRCFRGYKNAHLPFVK